MTGLFKFPRFDNS